jgi:hypothetical protein
MPIAKSFSIAVSLIQIRLLITGKVRRRSQEKRRGRGWDCELQLVTVAL